MSFIINGEDTFDVDYLDIDSALCGECEKRLKWDLARTADCCGYRYAYWPSMVRTHRTKTTTGPMNTETKPDLVVEAVRERVRMADDWSKSTSYPPANYFDAMMGLRRMLSAYDRFRVPSEAKP